MSSELEQIAERYERRKQSVGHRYDRLNPEVLARQQERQRALIGVLKAHGVQDLSATSVLEVGCGSGANLQELIWLGANPANVVANELLPERLELARRGLPAAVKVYAGDASALTFEPASFDLVYQSTVFSSILDDGLQRKVADAMWRWVRPAGGVLWYDFIYNNPSNPDVRGVPLKRIRELFPAGHLTFRRVTLAPPISRRVTRIHPALYGVFNAFPFLRTHVLCLIRKP